MITNPASTWDGHKDRTSTSLPSNMKSKRASSSSQVPANRCKDSPRHHKRPKLQANMSERPYVANIATYHNMASSSQPSASSIAAVEKWKYQDLAQACWAMSNAILGPLEQTPTTPSCSQRSSTQPNITTPVPIASHSKSPLRPVHSHIKQELTEMQITPLPASSTSPPKPYVFQFTTTNNLEEPVASALNYYFENYYAPSKPLCIPDGWLCAFDRDLFARWQEDTKTPFSQGGESFLGTAEEILAHTRTALEAQIQAREKYEEDAAGRYLQLVASDMLMKAGEGWDRINWFSKDMTLL